MYTYVAARLVFRACRPAATAATKRSIFAAAACPGDQPFGLSIFGTCCDLACGATGVRRRPVSSSVCLLRSRKFSDWKAAVTSGGAPSASSQEDQILHRETVETGEGCYQQALEAIRREELHKERIEEAHAEEQFNAMKRAHERHVEFEEKKANIVNGDDLSRSLSLSVPSNVKVHKSKGDEGRAKGLAVVRTISRQSRKQHRDGKSFPSSNGANSTSGYGDERTDWGKVALMFLEKAAFEFNHGKALVLLGNNSLEEARSLGCDGYEKPSGEEELDHSCNLIEDSLDPENGLCMDDLRHLSPIRRAMVLYRMAGEAGSSEGWFNLGHILWLGYPSGEAEDDMVIRPNPKAAIGAFHEAIMLGDADAMYFVGVQRLSEEHPDNPKSRMSGLKLVEQAAALSHGGALYYLALLHRNGDDGLGIPACSEERFREMLELAVHEGDADALFANAHCRMEDGKYGAALQGFCDAAAAGNADAAVSAGAMYFHGGYDGSVHQDKRKAFELYQAAAEMGSLEGWRNVAACYATGEGVPRCEATAKYIVKTMLKNPIMYDVEK